MKNHTMTTTKLASKVNAQNKSQAFIGTRTRNLSEASSMCSYVASGVVWLTPLGHGNSTDLRNMGGVERIR